MSRLPWRWFIPARQRARAETAIPFTDSQLELLKWIALGSMLVDHIGRYGFGMGLDSWAFAVGRVAFPLFAIVLGVNLGREGEHSARCFRVARRLSVWALISVVPAWLARGEFLPVNVLATLALGALVAGAAVARELTRIGRVAVVAVACVVGVFAEFGPPGVLLVAGVALWRNGVASVTGVVVAGGAFSLLIALNAHFGGVGAVLGTVAALAGIAAVRWSERRFARYGFLFYSIYPAHLAMIGAAFRAAT